MKKILTFAAALAFAAGAQAQDTYTNNTLVNSTGDVYGSARYVGMAGAMGALGTDLSTMSFNPAGIGLYRRSDVSMTFGAIWNNKSSDIYTNTHATVDQAGFVFSRPNEGNTSWAFGFNFQKKLNFNHAFDGFGASLNGLSQMDQMAELVSNGYATDNNLAGFALDPYLDNKGSFEKGYKGSYLMGVDNDGDGKNDFYVNNFRGNEYYYAQKTWGSLSEFNVDLAVNVNDRAYFGLDLGFENVDYHCLSKYSELRSFYDFFSIVHYGDYTLNNDHKISGWGFNLKLGAIVRPFEESPFRFGLAVETPTWYSLTNSTFYQLWDDTSGKKGTDTYESFLRYKLTTPWKFRASLGSTIGRNFAWDIDYEVANWSFLKQRVGEPGYTARDVAMNGHMRQNLKCVHNVRAGIEVKPSSQFAIRAGYNFTSAPTIENVSYDQALIDSRAMDYSTTTSYMRVKPAHMITLGLGYKYKSFYADLAYKIRSQKADFYPFDATYAACEPFISDYPTLAGNTADPVEVDKTTHQITATLGFKF